MRKGLAAALSCALVWLSLGPAAQQALAAQRRALPALPRPSAVPRTIRRPAAAPMPIAITLERLSAPSAIARLPASAPPADVRGAAELEFAQRIGAAPAAAYNAAAWRAPIYTLRGSYARSRARAREGRPIFVQR